jgi:hypothetical protein
MRDEELRSSPERLLPAIVIGLLLPMAIAPLVLIMTLLFFRSFDLVGQLWGIAAEATYHAFHPLIPGNSEGILMAVLIVVSPAVFVSDIAAVIVAWRVLRSQKQAAVALAASVSFQLSLVAAVCALLELTW